MSASSTQPIPTPPDPLPENLVAEPAVAGDLTEELRQVARPFGKPTLVLAGLLVVALAFAGGAWTHAAFGPSGAAPSPSAPQAGARTGGRGTAGTVEKVEGTTVTVKTLQGNEVKVSTSDDTTVGVTQSGKVGDLKPGQTVTVQGRTGSDGSVTAQAIVAQPGR
ncbi:DUF5666 domain-containing protein [Amycolatopsis jejuensis]|uniref:DUF5666 domain-containing protein n=1 Tax=Amycolatopsis jejuensis TaxID=330084 RepID=UPI00068A8B03|nr:DUF5666 domain-containing protein [Amycolatopsis jejuensis]